MQGGTKFSTIERENTFLIRCKLEGIGFTGLQAAVNIVESMVNPWVSSCALSRLVTFQVTSSPTFTSITSGL